MDVQERIYKTIVHEEPDRVPWFELGIDNLKIIKHFKGRYGIQGFGSALRKTHKLCLGNKKLLTKLLSKATYSKPAVKMAVSRTCKLYSDIGIDCAIMPLAANFIKFEKSRVIDEYARIFDVTKNPDDGMDFLYYRGGVLNDLEDYNSFPPLDPDDPKRERAFRIAKEVEKENKGKIYIIPTIVGMMEASWEGFGLEKFSQLLAKQKEIKKVFDDRGTFAVELTKRIIEWGETTSCYVFDDYGYKQGLFMSPRNYKKFVFPWLKKICDTAHKGGIKVILHSCGDIYDVFEDIIDAGVDALHPIEPTTANPEYDIFKLKQKYGDKITFVGNVSPQDLSDKGPDFIKDYTKKLLKEVAPGGGFIISSGHSINPAVKLENFLAMRDIIKQNNSYPIQI